MEDDDIPPWCTTKVEVIFDGGNNGKNPSNGAYGSFMLYIDGKQKWSEPMRLTFEGEHYTNNEAEYDTLIAALEWILARAHDPKVAYIIVRGDSRVVIDQISKSWAARDPRMRMRRDKAIALLSAFGGWHAEHHLRKTSVDVLGH